MTLSRISKEQGLCNGDNHTDTCRSVMINRMVDKLKFSEEGCWHWQASDNGSGYGIIWLHGRRRIAHRLFYQLLNGTIPDCLVVDHLCRNRRCLNPEHLEPVMPKENIQRGETGQKTGAWRKSWTHCINGHEFTEENTLNHRRKNNRVYRVCLACAREKNRKYYHAKKQ